MKFENFTKMEADEGIRKGRDEQLYGSMLDDAEFISNYLNSIDLNVEDPRKELMSDIISKANKVMQFIDNNKMVLSNSEAFNKIHDLSLVSKYANLNINNVSESMLDRADLNKQILDILNQLDDFLNKLVVYETNKQVNLEQEVSTGGMKV